MQRPKATLYGKDYLRPGDQFVQAVSPQFEVQGHLICLGINIFRYLQPAE